MDCSIDKRRDIRTKARDEYRRLKALDSKGIVEDKPNNIPNVKEAMKAMENVAKGKFDKVTRLKGVVQPQAKPTSTLYSESNTDVRVTKNHKRLDADLWKDASKMKDLFKQLQSNEGGPTPHSNALGDLLSDIVDRSSPVLNEFKVYLDDKAKKTQGMATIQPEGESDLVLDIAEFTPDTDMQPTEVYLHEVIHLSVEYAKRFSSNAMRSTMEELNTLWDQARKEITPAMLQVGEGKQAESKAQRRWDYMFNNEELNGISEFVAYGKTNENMSKLLANMTVTKKHRKMKGDSILDALAYHILKIYDTILDKFTKDRKGATGDKRLAYIVGEMWRVNSQTVQESSMAAKLMSKANEGKTVINKQLLDKLAKTARLTDTATMWVANRMPAGTGVLLTVPRNVVAWGLNPLITPDQVKAREAALTEFSEQGEAAGIGGLLAAEGTFRTIMNFLSPDDDLTTRVEKFGILNKRAESKRESTIAGVGGNILGHLKGAPKGSEKVLTEVFIENDLKSLYADYELDGIRNLLSSKTEVDKAIKEEYLKLDDIQSNKKVTNYYKSQAIGLGKFLVTGKSGSNLQKNAWSIANMLGTGLEPEVQLPYAEAVAVTHIIDRLASLNAIKYTDNTTNKKAAIELIDNHTKAVNAVLGYHIAHDETVMEYNRANKLTMSINKGEIKEMRPSYITNKIADNTPKTIEYMKKRGYKLKGETAVKGVYLYVSTVDGLAPFEKQALAKINVNKRMYNIGQVVNMRNEVEGKERSIEAVHNKVLNIHIKAKEDLQKQLEGIVEPVVDGYTMEILYDGEITYGVSTEKGMYKEATRQDDSAPKLLGAMIAEADEKVAATELNKEVMKTIWSDMAENYKRNRNKFDPKYREYIEIGPDSKHVNKRAAEFAADLWDNLPSNAKQEIYSREDGVKFIAIRRDLATMYVGSRAPSVLNMKIPVFNKNGLTTVELQKLLRNNGMDVVVSAIKIAGEIWSELVKLQKVNIVIKTPIILIENIISNFNYSFAMGQWPWEVAEQQLAMFKATLEYKNLNRREVLLENNLRSMLKAKNSPKAKTIRLELRAIQEKKRNNAVHDLMEAGLYSTVVEDVSSMDLQSKGRIDQFTEDFTDKVPQVVKTVGSALYITQDTSVFKMLMSATTDSDFVARANRYHFLRSSKGGSMTKEQATKRILDEFVNYSRIDSKTIKWLNDMGFAMFTKYFFGANKNLIARLKDDPLAILTMSLLMPGTNPSDASIFEKNYSYSINGPIDVTQNNFYQIGSPSSLQWAGLID